MITKTTNTKQRGKCKYCLSCYNNITDRKDLMGHSCAAFQDLHTVCFDQICQTISNIGIIALN